MRSPRRSNRNLPLVPRLPPGNALFRGSASSSLGRIPVKRRTQSVQNQHSQAEPGNEQNRQHEPRSHQAAGLVAFTPSFVPRLHVVCHLTDSSESERGRRASKEAFPGGASERGKSPHQVYRSVALVAARHWRLVPVPPLNHSRRLFGPVGVQDADRPVLTITASALRPLIRDRPAGFQSGLRRASKTRITLVSTWIFQGSRRGCLAYFHW